MLRLVVCALLILGGPSVSQPQAHPSASGNFQKLSAAAAAASQANHLDEAVTLYKKALAVRPAWAEGWWSLGTILYDQNAYAAAADAFQHLLLHDPKNGTAHLMLGLCQYQLNLDEKALENIKAAQELGIQKDDNLKHILQYHEAMLLLRKGRFESAMEVLYFLVHDGVQSSDLDGAMGMGVLLMRPKDFPPEGSPARRIVLRVGHAENLGLLQKFDEARKNYLELVQDVPDFPNIHYAYGRFLLELHETDEATLQFQAEIKNNPKHSLAMLRIASVKYRSDSAAGVAFAEEAVKLNPQLAFGHYLLGLLLADIEDFQRAIPEMEIARKTFVNDPTVYFMLGNAYSRTGRKQEAAKARATFKRLNEVGSGRDSGEAGNQRPFRLSPSGNSGNGNETKPQ